MSFPDRSLVEIAASVVYSEQLLALLSLDLDPLPPHLAHSRGFAEEAVGALRSFCGFLTEEQRAAVEAYASRFRRVSEGRPPTCV